MRASGLGISAAAPRGTSGFGSGGNVWRWWWQRVRVSRMRASVSFGIRTAQSAVDCGLGTGVSKALELPCASLTPSGVPVRLRSDSWDTGMGYIACAGSFDATSLLLLADALTI